MVVIFAILLGNRDASLFGIPDLAVPLLSHTGKCYFLISDHRVAH